MNWMRHACLTPLRAGLIVGLLVGTVLGSRSSEAQTYDWTTIAGLAGQSGSADGTNSAARFNFPVGVAVDSSNNLYVADGNNNTIRKIRPVVTAGQTNWVTTTIAGLAGSQGTNDGINSAARFHHPYGVAVDSSNNVYVADGGNWTIRKITPVVTAGHTNWVTTTIAGTAGQSGATDGTNNTSQFLQPYGVAVDSGGNVYVADRMGNAIRKITPVGTNWVTTTIAGLLHSQCCGYTDGTNSDARFYDPTGVAVDSSNNLYVADEDNDIIRKITPVVGTTNWVTTTIAGLGGQHKGSADGTNSAAQFSWPWGIAVDNSDNVYVADLFNSTIRKITASGTNWVTTTIGGLAGNTGSADGTNSDAQFAYPYGVAVDRAGNVYVADTYVNSTIRMGTPKSAPSPSITIQPQSLTVTNGDQAAFSVAASGTAPLFYQWQKDGTNLVNGGSISGATSNTLSLSTTTTNDSGNYLVIVTNVYGSVTSSVVPLVVVVVPPPVAGFSGSPTNGAAPLAVTFTNTSTGNITNGFWNFGDSNTTNTTESSLNYTYTTGGTYTVSLTVSGLGGSNTSTRSNYIVAVLGSHLVVSPAGRNYGVVPISQSSNQTFSVINNGQQTLTGSASVGSTFAIVSGSPYIVPGGGTNIVTVGFSPVAGGIYTGTVVFASNGGSSTNTVTGLGNAPPPQITAPLAVTNELTQVGGLPVVAGGEPICFTVGVYDPNANSLSCLWDFGNGATSTDCDPCHVFTNCGPHTVSVVVSDGVASTNATSTVAVACTLTITKMQVTLNFAKTNSDSCSLTATLPDLDANYNLTNKVVTLDIGGAQVPFTLDAKGNGRGTSAFGSCKLAYGNRTGWTFTANLAKGSWQTPWAAYGLEANTVANPGVWVTMPVVVVIDTEAFAGERAMLYTAKWNKSGSAK